MEQQDIDVEQSNKEYSYFEHNTTLFDWDDGQEHAATVDSMYIMIVGPRNYVYHYRHKFAKLQELEQIPEHKRREMYIVDLNVPIPEPGQKVAVEVRVRRLNRFLSETSLDLQSPPAWLATSMLMNRFNHYTRENWGLTNK